MSSLTFEAEYLRMGTKNGIWQKKKVPLDGRVLSSIIRTMGYSTP
jgi:hypothetical protein